MHDADPQHRAQRQPGRVVHPAEPGLRRGAAPRSARPQQHEGLERVHHADREGPQPRHCALRAARRPHRKPDGRVQPHQNLVLHRAAGAVAVHIGFNF